MKYNDNGTYKDIYVKAIDTLPVGTEVDFDGSVVPSGWTAVDNVLWTNPSPNAEFGSQNITLSSSDYDYLEVLYTAQGSNEQYIKSTGKIPKGKDIKIDDIYIQHSNTNTIRIYSRLLSYTNATTFSVNSARYASSFTSSEANNNFAIPYKIIGHKG